MLIVEFQIVCHAILIVGKFNVNNVLIAIPLHPIIHVQAVITIHIITYLTALSVILVTHLGQT